METYIIVLVARRCVPFIEAVVVVVVRNGRRENPRDGVALSIREPTYSIVHLCVYSDPYYTPTAIIIIMVMILYLHWL
jgi:hypothetical protein